MVLITRIGIIGSRSRDSDDDLKKTIKAFSDLIQKYHAEEGEIMIISGGAKKGGDRFAEVIAEQFASHKTIYYPQYRLYGKIAPLVRNTQIAKFSDALIACWDNKSTGTDNAIKAFKTFHPLADLIII